MADMFGDAAEEKEVAQIAGKTKEARSHKSFDTMRLVAKYVSEKCICDILIPLKDVSLHFPIVKNNFIQLLTIQVLASSHSYKLVKKSDSCLQQIVQGLSENNFISPESLVTFAFGTSSESIPALQSIIKANNKQKKKLTDGSI
jgi:U3 small nucleolar RNA-associated protein 20